MRVGFYMSTQGGSPLVGGLERGLRSLGHIPEDYLPGSGYDFVLVFNQCAHTLDYRYPTFPTPNIPIVFIDSAEYGYFKRLPNIFPDYANAFTPSSMASETKNTAQQQWLQYQLEGRSFPYFLREFSKYVRYPLGYHPIDYPLYYSSIADQPNREEYLSRDLGLFVSWGASHPWRMGLTQQLRDCNVRSEITVIGDSVPRMPQDRYFARTSAAKCSVSFDGYGSGSFRMTEVLVRTCLLNGPLSIHRYAPLNDGVNCVEYEIYSDGEEFLGSNIDLKLREILDNPSRSFEIYRMGYEHCMTYYSEKATAEYLLRVVQGHDWSRPTSLVINEAAYV